jgi:hypothetical protein
MSQFPKNFSKIFELSKVSASTKISTIFYGTVFVRTLIKLTPSFRAFSKKQKSLWGKCHEKSNFNMRDCRSKADAANMIF